MNCPHCNEELEFDYGFYSSEVELDASDAVGRVEFTLMCNSCGESLGEYSFELEQDIADFASSHDDSDEHELSVTLSNESFIETLHNNVQYLGAEATVTVSCMCGTQVEYLWSTSERAEEIMKELGE